MGDRHCTCDKLAGIQCEVCSERIRYWCESCKQQTDERRCPLCGLKTQKMK